jgi:hypothetical protein
MQVRKLSDYVREYVELSAEGFRDRYVTPMLVSVQSSMAGDEEEEREFETAILSREDLQRQRRASVGDGTEEVFAVVKRKGGAFQDRIGVGRARNVDIPIPDARISKYHGFFSRTEDGAGWQFTDAGSKNGSSIQGTKLEARKAVLLHNATEIAFGSFRFRFYSEGGFAELCARRAAADDLVQGS